MSFPIRSTDRDPAGAMSLAVIEKRLQRHLGSCAVRTMKRPTKKFGNDEKIPRAKLMLLSLIPCAKKVDVDESPKNIMRAPGLVPWLMGLKSLPIIDYEKPLDEKDIPHMGEMDRAESRYFMFLKQLSRQIQSCHNTSSSFFRAIVSCHKNEILVSGLFALLKVLTLSAGPMLLNAFIKVSVGMGTFKYEGYVLASGMFLVKFLESLSQRQGIFAPGC